MRTEVFQAGDGRFNTFSVPVDVSIFQPEGKMKPDANYIRVEALRWEAFLSSV